jgi:predicted site-specific integrase-resolvase
MTTPIQLPTRETVDTSSYRDNAERFWADLDRAARGKPYTTGMPSSTASSENYVMRSKTGDGHRAKSVGHHRGGQEHDRAAPAVGILTTGIPLSLDELRDRMAGELQPRRKGTGVSRHSSNSTVRVPEQRGSTNGVALIYCRVSTKQQELEGTSLDSQEERCRQKAQELGYEVGRVTREVYTGAELWDRPLLSRDRANIRARQFQALVVYATDRLARDPIHLAIIAEECERAGVDLIFVTRRGRYQTRDLRARGSHCAAGFPVVRRRPAVVSADRAPPQWPRRAHSERRKARTVSGWEHIRGTVEPHDARAHGPGARL